ncbi:DUF1799 domain-containing protein [Halomonas smyrnensis]|uniref:DUF1799 domain-containing protein n=1 Tax=Halomonas smyrnensis TaxID=720605 RepID=UPI0002E895F2|nr:DUF1799 domain-containing protein [Halomonas smyrnensis]
MEDTRAADANALGIAQPEIPPEEIRCEIWAEHHPALELFLACRTQWRIIAGMGGAHYQGLDYLAVESVMRMRGVEDMAGMLEQLQQLEAGALELLNA